LNTMFKTKIKNLPPHLKTGNPAFKCGGLSRPALLFIFLIVFIFGGYFLYQLKSFLFGPQIIVNNLKEYSAAAEPFFEIQGTAKNISEFYLNGRKIFTDTEGNFKENFLLANGMNTLQLKTKDKFGNQIARYYYVVLKSQI